MVRLSGSALLTFGAWAASFVSTAVAYGTLDALSGGAAVECHRPFPAFLWAGSRAGDQRQAGYRHAATDAHDVGQMLLAAAKAEELVELVVVVLTEDEAFSTAGVSNINAALKAEGGCLHAKSATTTFPYTYPSATGLSMALPMLADGTGATVQKVPVQDTVSTARESGLFTDGKLDIMVATVPSTNTIVETDDDVRGVIASLEGHSNGRFLLLWTGDFHGEDCGRRSLAAQSASRRRLQESTASFRTIKITPDILSGLLVLLLFLTILFTGLSCVGDIECPQSFALVCPAKGKEY